MLTASFEPSGIKFTLSWLILQLLALVTNHLSPNLLILKRICIYSNSKIRHCSISVDFHEKFNYETSKPEMFAYLFPFQTLKLYPTAQLFHKQITHTANLHPLSSILHCRYPLTFPRSAYFGAIALFEHFKLF